MRKLLNKKLNKKGFTLAELLIVVAIIAVLVAIAIPIFTTQLEKSRDATDQANVRAAYAELSAALIASDDVTASTYKGTCTWTKNADGAYVAAVAGKGTNDKWDNLKSDEAFKIGTLTVAAKSSFTTATFAVNADNQITAITLG